MKKRFSKKRGSDMLDGYGISTGVRLDRDVAAFFPDSEVVNEALRGRENRAEKWPGKARRSRMTPIVRYMLLCDDARIDPDNPNCTHIDCLMSNIVSLEKPPFPLLRELICVYLVLTEGRGTGPAQIRVVYCDSEPEQLIFGSPAHELDFTGHSPLESLGVVFRMEACPFPRPGRYSVQFWYNEQKVEERPLRLR